MVIHILSSLSVSTMFCMYGTSCPMTFGLVQESAALYLQAAEVPYRHLFLQV